jgi:hypothetical protein
MAVTSLQSILKVLREDYEAGYLQLFTELVHANLFCDFLEIAKYLLQEAYKDPAAVIAGGVLEQHLRKLCAKNGVALLTRPNLDTMNSDLARQNAYGKEDWRGELAARTRMEQEGGAAAATARNFPGNCEGRGRTSVGVGRRICYSGRGK